jgi:exonuclease SbcC
VADRLGVLRGLHPRERELAQSRHELDELTRTRARLRGEVAKLRSRVETLPEERAAVSRRLDEARTLAATVPGARLAFEEAERAREAASALPAARADQDCLAERLGTARDDAHAARERHLDIVERRLRGMAAELAGALADGRPCQVCGSTEHPRPAEPSQDAVTEADQRRARAEAEQLQAIRESIQADLERSRQALDRLEQLAGGLTAEQAVLAVTATHATLSLAEAAEGSMRRLQDRLCALSDEEHDAAKALQDAHDSTTHLDGRILVLEGSVAALTKEVAASVDGLGDSLAEAVATCERSAGLLARAIDTIDEHARAERLAEQARRRADGEAQAQGFASATEAADCLLEPAVVEALRAAARRREEARTAALAVLAEPEVAAVADADPPDLAALRQALDEARVAARSASALVGSTAERCEALTGLVDDLASAFDEWAPLHDDHGLADRMSRLVRGLGSDNQLQMRLSSYVLATRLDQVLDAANERLGQMRDQRYTLRRTGTARGGTRAGLGLEVLDDWTGEVRAPTTLSGGETFVVSLALALGLADVVSHESGGLRVDTLFVDEGFGMLDPDTLDDVMDTIDTLRAGGRTVGVVSHVTELRGRIPTQLHVTLGRHGSTVEVRTLVA